MNQDELAAAASDETLGGWRDPSPLGIGSSSRPNVSAAGQTVTPTGKNPRQPAMSSNASTQDELMPDEKEVEAIAEDVVSNSVAPKSIIREILDTLKARQPAATAKDLFSLAWACYHNGSSKFVTLSTDAPCGIAHAELKDLVEDFCTLRQFCGYYAKTCYVTGRQQKKPPANWARKGFPDEAKFAAFDFFNAVLSDSSPNPPAGMRFKPTQPEILSHSMNAKMSILESRKSSNMISNRADLLAQQQIHEPPKPLMLTF
ncbi:coat protein [Garlic virus J]|nr:coat protein [Garlic virus J]